MIEEPSPEQAKILAAFGYEAARGVLQKIKSECAVLSGVIGFFDQKISKLLYEDSGREQNHS